MNEERPKTGMDFPFGSAAAWRLFMRGFLLLMLLTLPLPALAWFGPGNADECRSQFAKRAPDTQGVAIARSQCATAFDTNRHPVERKRALCVAKAIPDLRSGAAWTVAYDECKARHPDPACPEGQSFDFQRKLCVVWASGKALIPYDGPVEPMN